MSASYPSTAKTFISRSAGQTIQPAHVNDLQDEVNAIETALLGTIAHNLTINGILGVTAFGVHYLQAAGTGTNDFLIQNTTAGAGNGARLRVGNDNDTSLTILQSFSSTFTSSGANQASGSILYANGTGGLSIYTAATAPIRFYTHGNEVARLFSSGGMSLGNTTDPGNAALSANAFLAATGYYMNTWPTTASAANAQVSDGNPVQRSTSLRKAKQDIETITVDEARRTVEALRAVSYRSALPNDDQTRTWPGFIAEEIETANPNLAMYDPAGALEGVAYDRVCAYLVTVIQDLTARVHALEER